MNQFKDASNGKGIVLSITEKHIDDTINLIRLLRALNNKLPIQIIYFNDISQSSKTKIIKAAREEINNFPKSYEKVYHGKQPSVPPSPPPPPTLSSMEYINNILGLLNQVQLVEEAIPTLCNRLQHATMSSDRRSAVLGLKSFSRQYRETVVEHGLRPLISTFRKDIDNPQIVKAILETLLILFIRGESDEDLTRGWISQQSRLQNGKYPSPLLMEDISLDQLSLWIADALIQDEEILRLLIENLSETNDYHAKLYTIQLLESLASSRGSRTKDCLLNIPTSMSVLCLLLQDSNEPVRNEAILLLMAVANDNFNIQKLVAFENTFETLFDIIAEEGGIRGSILVQDCLTLITNLLQFNASNQKFFL